MYHTLDNVQLSNIILGLPSTLQSWNYKKPNIYSQDYIPNSFVRSTTTHTVFFRTSKMYFSYGVLKNLFFAHRLGVLHSVEIFTFFGALEYNSEDIIQLLL